MFLKAFKMKRQGLKCCMKQWIRNNTPLYWSFKRLVDLFAVLQIGELVNSWFHFLMSRTGKYVVLFFTRAHHCTQSIILTVSKVHLMSRKQFLKSILEHGFCRTRNIQKTDFYWSEIKAKFFQHSNFFKTFWNLLYKC